MKRLVAFAAVVFTLVVGPAMAASAHPLGNFTVNQYSGLRVGAERVDVELVVDMAEIPTFQARRQLDADGAAYAPRRCQELAGRVAVELASRRMPLHLGTSQVTFPPGAAGLPTLRLTCSLSAATGHIDGERRLLYRDGNYADRVGWREITAVGDGVTLTGSTVGRASVSDRLTHYPQDLLQSPLDERSASGRVRPGGGAAAAETARLTGPSRVLPRGIDRATRAFTSLVARRHLTLAFGLVAAALALLLGAVHALAPGHGKTVMAAYLVGQRGSPRQAALIGLTVTATHTAGVLALGLALAASTVVAPESLYPWLGLASGALLASVGAGLLRRALRARQEHRHAHPHVHPHPHAERPVAWPGLVAMGFAGGLVPSPSALVVLLGAIALGRAWFGVVLVVVYGMGMAATLTGAGLLLVRARALLDRRSRQPRRPWLASLARLLPVASSSVIVVMGLFVAARGAAQV